MSDSFSFIELDDQRVELLPARTVLSTIYKAGGGCHAGNGGAAYGGIGVIVDLDLLTSGGHDVNNAGNAYGGPGGSCK
jgi:hypothetical protein